MSICAFSCDIRAFFTFSFQPLFLTIKLLIHQTRLYVYYIIDMQHNTQDKSFNLLRIEKIDSKDDVFGKVGKIFEFLILQPHDRQLLNSVYKQHCNKNL